MVKKGLRNVLMTVLCGVITAGSVFAADKPVGKAVPPAVKHGIISSFGVGQCVNNDFGGGEEYSVRSSGRSVDTSIVTPLLVTENFLFFDMRYVELSGGFFAGMGLMRMILSDATGTRTPETEIMMQGVSLGVLGKIPVYVHPKFFLFPLLGIDGILMISVRDNTGAKYANYNGKEAAGDFSALWFKAGFGFDFLAFSKGFIRFEALYGIRLPNRMEKEMAEFLDQISDGAGTNRFLLGHGVTIKAAVGFFL
jgi:hypothetical protein